MKFLIAEYAEKKENGLLKLMRKTGILKSYALYDTMILDTEGLFLTLPFLPDELDDYEYCLSQTKKAVEFAKNECGEIVYCLPDEIKVIGGVNGKNTAALFLWKKFKDIAEETDLKDKKVVIMGMEEKIIRIALEGIYDKVNFLSLLTPETEDISDRTKEIYCETGLDIIFISSVKSPIFMDADIIINCGMTLDGFNAIKRNATYITLEKESLIKDVRKDLVFHELYEIDVKGVTFPASQIEAVLSAKSYGYRNFCASRYYKDKAERAYLSFKEAIWDGNENFAYNKEEIEP